MFIDVLGILLIIVTTLLILFYIRRKANFLALQLTQLSANSARMTWENQAIRRLAPEGTLLPQPSPWSLDSYALSWLVAELEARRPACVVELGSGLSTIVIGLKLRALGHGRLVSIDHDAKFAGETRSWLDFHELQDVVEMRLAPLRPRSEDPQKPLWYDETALRDLGDVAMLVVDGPPMLVHPQIRAPALPFFATRFARDWVVYVDDANRSGEQSFLDEWSKSDIEITIQRLPFPKGGAVVSPFRDARPLNAANPKM